MLEHNIYIGEKEVILSGSVLAPGDEDVIIYLDPKDKSDSRLEVRISFINDNEIEGQKISMSGRGEKAHLELRNFNDALGTGLKTPVSIASNKTSILEINFRVYAHGSDKLVHYTFYKRPKVSNE